MKITNVEIKFFQKSGFNGISNDRVTHRKVLPYLSIVQATEGSYGISFGDKQARQTGEGGFFIAPTNVLQTIEHRVNPQSGTMSARWIFLDVEINKLYRLDELYTFSPVLKSSEGTRLNQLFDRLFQSNSLFENYALCFQIIDVLMANALPSPQRSLPVENAVLYIKEHYAEPMTVEQLANTACLSKPRFHTLFKQRYGVSPISFLNDYRLSIAAIKLSETTEAIHTISQSVGIDDNMYFSKLFRKTYGVSPSEYRKNYQNNSD